MLVLTRKREQCIDIGPDIKITIVAMERGKVRIGIEAPRSLKIKRSELPDREVSDEQRIQWETEEAGRSKDSAP